MTRRNRQRLLRAPNAHSVASPVSCARRIASLDYVLLSGRMANALSPMKSEMRDKLAQLPFEEWSRWELSDIDGQAERPKCAGPTESTRDQTGALGSMPLRSPRRARFA